MQLLDACDYNKITILSPEVTDPNLPLCGIIEIYQIIHLKIPPKIYDEYQTRQVTRKLGMEGVHTWIRCVF